MLSRGFWISQSEITEAQWDAIDLTNIEESSRKLMATIEGSHQPKTMISWNEATEFCDRLTRFVHAESELLRKRNRLTESLVFKNDEAFRLPTEAEWEFACRAGTTTAFSCGDDLTTIANGIWFLDAIPGTELTHAQFVKQKSPNPWGLFDMHGNVWEWCSDSYERERTLGTDPMVRTASSMQVLRGGSWRYPVNRARSANRDGRAPDYKSDDIGFRIVLGPMVHPIDD